MTEKPNPEITNTEEEVNNPEQPQSQSVSVDTILNSYPVDREKAKSFLLLGIHNSLHRIANALEYFANKEITKDKAAEISKQK